MKDEEVVTFAAPPRDFLSATFQQQQQPQYVLYKTAPAKLMSEGTSSIPI